MGIRKKKTERKENAPPCPHSLSPVGGEDVRGSSSRWNGPTQPREPLGIPGPGHWFEPHPRGRLEHPWSLRPGTLRAQKPASLHFLCILWVSAGRGTLLSELDRLELALPLLLPEEHLPRQARRSHQPHRHRRLRGRAADGRGHLGRCFRGPSCSSCSVCRSTPRGRGESRPREYNPGLRHS